MDAMVREQRKSCKASPFNTPATNLHPVNQHPARPPAPPPKRPKAGSQHTRPLSRPFWAFPYEQPQNRTASLIARAYRNRERHKNKSLEKWA